MAGLKVNGAIQVTILFVQLKKGVVVVVIPGIKSKVLKNAGNYDGRSSGGLWTLKALPIWMSDFEKLQ